MSEWQEHELQDLVTIQNGYAFKSSEYIEFQEDALEVLKMGHIERGGGLRKEPKKSFVPRKDNLKKWILDEGDIVMAMTDMKDNVVILGVPALVDKSNHYVLNQRVARLKVTSPNADLIFLYNYLKWPDFLWELQSKANSGVQVNLSTEAIKTAIIELPPLAEQKAIAAVLSSLDDKIDLLHRQNQTLEATAEALFRHHFIEQARPDWEEGTLGDVADNIRDAVSVKNINVDSKYIGLEHIDRRSISLKQYGFGSEVNSNKYIFQEMDILFGKLRPYFHKVCFAPFSGICSTDILVIRPTEPEWVAFCLFAFFQDDVVEFANLGSGGTRMPRTDWAVLKTFPITIPPVGKIEQFNQLTLPSLDKILHNLEQIRTLEQLRDTLLPQLMRGTLRLRP